MPLALANGSAGPHAGLQPKPAFVGLKPELIMDVRPLPEGNGNLLISRYAEYGRPRSDALERFPRGHAFSLFLIRFHPRDPRLN